MDLANPIGTVMSVAMMLRYSFDMIEEADAIEAAVNRVLDDGYRTADIWREGFTKVGCKEMGAAIAARL
jgi:3-isopropylmalate dehydrogenase